MALKPTTYEGAVALYEEEMAKPPSKGQVRLPVMELDNSDFQWNGFVSSIFKPYWMQYLVGDAKMVVDYLRERGHEARIEGGFGYTGDRIYLVIPRIFVPRTS